MKDPTKILNEIKTMLMRAELQIVIMNGELSNLDDPMNASEILIFQKELESVANSIVRLENTLIKKINQAMRQRVTALIEDNDLPDEV